MMKSLSGNDHDHCGSKRRRLNDRVQYPQASHHTTTLHYTTFTTFTSHSNHLEHANGSGIHYEDHITAGPHCRATSRDQQDNDEENGGPGPEPSLHDYIGISTSLNGECCYGMLSSIPVGLVGRLAYSIYTRVLYESPGILRLHDGSLNKVFQVKDPKQTDILDQLGTIEGVNMECYCHSRNADPATNKPRGKRGGTLQSWGLNIILYGPSELEEAMGKYLSQHSMYLQDPLHCDRNVPYRNPHIVPPEEDGTILMTGALNKSLGNLEIERLDAGPDLLAQMLSEEALLPETEGPNIVKTPLFSHQKQALTFMLRREQGWYMDSSDDIWSMQKDAFGRTGYRNNVSGICQAQAPPQFQGGLLADDMGLGKTLSMICLIAANQLCNSPPSPPLIHPVQGVAVKTTLLIVPPALIQPWQNQLHMHLKSKKLKVHVYHGTKRNSIGFLADFDIVITSFYTVSSIWRKCKDDQDDSNSIFSLLWHRIVLDEAHIIQNANNQLAQSCCALKSVKKWAITGTPIQNKLSDFASIVKFLQVYPYSDTSVFDEDISKPWQRDDHLGFLRLKSLVRAITIARTKSVVDLPPRDDFIHHLEFTEEEKQLYEDAKKKTVSLLQDAIFSSQFSQVKTSFNALQRLNALRLICSHGLLAQSNLGIETSGLNTPNIYSQASFNNSYMGGAAEDLLGGHSVCTLCGINLLEVLMEGKPSADQGFYSGLVNQSFCYDCKTQSASATLRPPGDSQYASLPGSPMSIDSSPAAEENQTSHLASMPTKIKALVADLIEHSSNEKSAVFSYWTYTLDLVQTLLDWHNIPYTRIDGKTSLPKRTEALRAFEKNDSIRVILVSITCGGAGLDLTAASRAYLLEPHWNPMIEEQALCRVHRVGQTRSVTTVRYLMRDSFEEQVVEIQKRKKLLAKVTFGPNPMGEDGFGLGTLQYLKSVLE